MANYLQRDIKTFDDGELDLSSGDLEIADAQQSQRQLVINLLSTTRGGYAFNRLFGWGCETYSGKKNSIITHNLMRADLGAALRNLPDLAVEDIDFAITAIDDSTAGIVLRHAGGFFDENGRAVTTPIVLGWRYAFLTGEIELEE